MISKQITVLIVEDSENDADLILHQIRKAGYVIDYERVETAGQMRAALGRQTWDLVIADYSLPQFSATAALAILQKTGLDVPFIVVSGTIGEENAVELMKSGAHDYVMKENLTRLVPAIERELSEAQIRRARHAAEKALSESEARLRHYFELGLIGIAITSPTKGFLEVNDEICRILGYERSELLQKSWPQLTHPDDLDADAAHFSRVLAGEIDGYSMDKRFIRKDGQVVYATISVKCLRRAEGSVDYFVALLQDITERKRTEEALRKSEGELRTLFGAMTEVVLVLDAEGRYVKIAPTNPLNLYRPSEELLGKKIHEILPKEDADTILHQIKRALEACQTIDSEYKLNIESREVWFDGRISPLTENTVFWIARDITERVQAEMSLREMQARLSAIVRTSPLAMIVTDPEGRVTLWNEAAERIFGWKEEEVLHKPTPIVPEDRMEEIRQVRSRVLKGETLANTESVRQRKDGSRIPVSFSVTALRAANHAPVEILGIVADITERKRIEESLRESEARFSAIFHSSPVSCSLTRLEDSVLIDINNAWLKLTGLTREEALGRTVTELGAWANPGDRDLLVRKLREQGMVRDFEFQVRHKSGSLSYVLMSAELIELGGERYMLSLAQDITGHKRAEAALKASEEQYRQVIEQINEVLFSVDQTGVIAFMSPVIRAVAGYEPEDLIGHSFTDFIHPDDRPALVKEFNAREKAKIEPIEYRIRTKSGETVWARSAGKALIEGGEFKGIKGLLTDVTEQKKARDAAVKLEEQMRQSQKLEAIGTLAGGVAHDFNNLLTIILGNADLMLMDLREDHPYYRPLEETRKAANRAASLTRQLLAFSRKQVIEPKILDLNEIIRGTQKMLGRLIGENIRLETNLAPDLWHVEADPGQVEQVIMNLAVNARDAMPEGGQLTLWTQNREVDEPFFREKGISGGPGSYAVLRVTDTGIGMSTEIMERIFEPFFTTKGLGKGTGLGLSTVYGIVKQNRGYIFVQSEPGAGTTFEILLPKAEGKKNDEVRQIGPQEEPLGSETILVVEDNEDVRGIAVATLKRYGYLVLEAPDGESALNFIRSGNGPVHLLITDVIMPGMGGDQLADHVRVLSPVTKVLFMSGYTDESISRYGVLRPGIALLSKPFTPEALAKKVREVLGRTEGEGSLS